MLKITQKCSLYIKHKIISSSCTINVHDIPCSTRELKVERNREQCLLKPDVTDTTQNTLNNFIPSQTIMKILSTGGCLNKTNFIRIIQIKVAIMLEKSLQEYHTVVVA